jgi:hypothetical protein
MAFLALGLASCKTGGGGEVMEAAQPAGLSDTLTLAKDDGQALYLLMISVEMNAGAKVPKDQLHATRGVGHCRRDTEPQTCQVFVRLPEGNLGAPQPLSGDLVDKLEGFVQKARPELGKDKVYLLDLTCDYLGKKSPPYDVEEVSCKAAFPRTTREAVFDEPVAVELADQLRGEAPLGDKLVTLVGSLACRFAEGAGRVACMVRAMKNGLLTEKVAEVSAKNAPAVAKKMQEAGMDLRTLGAETKEAKEAIDKPLGAPKEMAGALVCVVDGTKVGADGSGTRLYQCRVTL